MKINQYIDHTILKADARKDEVKKIVEETLEYNFKSICVNSSYVAMIRDMDKDIRITSVIGFPLGAMTTKAKVFETEDAIKDGADEIDMVINVGRLKDKDYAYVLEDIKEVKKACGDKILKVIIETCLLDDEEKIKVCELSKEAGADFVKTSTGFSTGGATAKDIKLMRETVGEELGVKASGGVRSLEDAELMIENGASRIGASASIAICEGTKSNSTY